MEKGDREEEREREIERENSKYWKDAIPLPQFSKPNNRINWTKLERDKMK